MKRQKIIKTKHIQNNIKYDKYLFNGYSIARSRTFNAKFITATYEIVTSINK